MPVMIIHHEIYSKTHCCFHHNGNWFSVAGFAFCFMKSSYHIIHIITIHVQHIPSKILKLFSQISKVHHLGCRAINLLSVYINGCNDIIYFFG